jgi:hypothetical protein
MLRNMRPEVGKQRKRTLKRGDGDGSEFDANSVAFGLFGAFASLCTKVLAAACQCQTG